MSGGTLGGPGWIRRPTRKTGRVQEAHPEGRVGPGGPPGGPVGVSRPPGGPGGVGSTHGGLGWVGRPTRRPGGVRRPTCRAGRDWEAHKEDREGSGGLLEVRQGSRVYPESSEGVGRPFWWAEKCWEALPKVRAAHPKVWEVSESPHKGSEGVGRPSRWAGRCLEEAHPKVRKVQPEVRVGSGCPP